MGQRPSWEANRFSASQRLPAFHGSWRFITTCTRARHLSLSLSKLSVQVRVLLYECSVTRYFLRWGVVSTSPNSQAGGPPFVGCPRLLIQYIRSYPPYWRPFLHPQPEDAPCCGDRDALITSLNISTQNVWLISIARFIFVTQVLIALPKGSCTR